jgi:hypothetical protein
MAIAYSFEDLGVFFSDFAVTLSYDGGEIPCLFSYKSDPLAFQAGGRNISAIIKTDDLGSLDSGTEVAIADKSYLITEIEPIEDGQVTRLMMEEL